MADETTDLTVAEAFEFFADRSATEEENFADDNDTTIPNHAETLVVDEANELLKTVTSIEMSREMADDPDEDEMADSLAESVVDLLSAVGTLKHERDIDIAEAVAERMDFIEQFEQFEEAMRDAETKEEHMEAMDEHLTEEMAAQMGMGPMQSGPEIGENVDKDGYEHDEVDKTFQ